MYYNFQNYIVCLFFKIFFKVRNIKLYSLLLFKFFIMFRLWVPRWGSIQRRQTGSSLGGYGPWNPDIYGQGLPEKIVHNSGARWGKSNYLIFLDTHYLFKSLTLAWLHIRLCLMCPLSVSPFCVIDGSQTDYYNSDP